MAKPEVVVGLSINCVGAYPKKSPLAEPVSVTVVVYPDGMRQVGCPYLSMDGKGLCEVADIPEAERLSCVHRFPQQFSPGQTEDPASPERSSEWTKGASAVVLKNGHYDYYKQGYEGVDVVMAQWHKKIGKITKVITLVTITQEDKVLVREDPEAVYQEYKPSFQAWVRLCDKYGYNNEAVKGAWYFINYPELVKQEEITPAMQAVTQEDDFKLLDPSMEQQFRNTLLKQFVFRSVKEP